MTQKAKRPASAHGAFQVSGGAAGYVQDNPWSEVADLDERRERELIAELLDRGYRVAVQCVDCGQWLTAARSVAEHVGPRCRSRRGGGE